MNCVVLVRAEAAVESAVLYIRGIVVKEAERQRLSQSATARRVDVGMKIITASRRVASHRSTRADDAATDV